MSASQIWVAMSIVALALVAGLVFFVGKRRAENRLTPWASLAFGFIIAGLVFGENRMIAYSLMGAGVILAVVDLAIRSRKG
jgi:uncharacterized membrane protein